jgi:carbamoyltransferase
LAPLAPSVTKEEFDRLFTGCTPSPYMVIATSASSLGAERVCGVVHVDGTSRPQVVTAPDAYHDLLIEMGALSGIEAMTCTSFNRAGEPMVYGPADALRSARGMGLDVLAGEGWSVRITGV